MPPKRANRFWKYLRNFRKRQNGENGSCGTSASIKMEEMALAELPQASKWRKWRLRNFRKRQKVLRGTCGTPANTKKFLERLAGLPQTPKSFPRDLRGSRKHQKVSRETCGTPASISKSNFPPCMFDFWPWRGDRHKKSRACDVESQALLCLSAKKRRTGGAVRGLHVIYSTISTIGAPT